MRSILWWLGIPIAAFFGSMVGALPVAVLGLSVPGLIVGPLSLLAGALAAALSAGWVGNLSSTDNTRSRLLAILAASCAGAVAALVVGALLLAAPRLLGTPAMGLNLISVLALCALILCAVTTIATWRLREERVGRLGLDGAAALVLAAMWFAILLLISGPGYLLGVVPASFTAGLSVVAFSGVNLAFAVVGIGLVARRWRQGPQGSGLGLDAAITLALIGLAPVVVEGTIYLGCQMLTCGP